MSVTKLKIRVGDTVQVTSGSDKGKKGEVLAVAIKTMKVKVQGVRVQTHYDKKDGLVKKEGFLDYSNVKLVGKAAGDKAPKTSKKAASKRKSA